MRSAVARTAALVAALLLLAGSPVPTRAFCAGKSTSVLWPARCPAPLASALRAPALLSILPPQGSSATSARSRWQFIGASASGTGGAGGTVGVDELATQRGAGGGAVANRIRLLWELENAVQTRDFEKAQELQSSLRRDLALDEGELLPVGKDAFKGKQVLVAGANGRLGAQVVRELLRRGCSVRATVRSSDDVRDYERLSYEIGAEEGLGDIQAPWVRKTAEMSGTAEMASYGLARLSIVDCNLMDPDAVAKALRDVDSVFWCASDFDGGS